MLVYFHFDYEYPSNQYLNLPDVKEFIRLIPEEYQKLQAVPDKYIRYDISGDDDDTEYAKVTYEVIDDDIIKEGYENMVSTTSFYKTIMEFYYDGWNNTIDSLMRLASRLSADNNLRNNTPPRVFLDNPDKYNEQYSIYLQERRRLCEIIKEIIHKYDSIKLTKEQFKIIVGCWADNYGTYFGLNDLPHEFFQSNQQFVTHKERSQLTRIDGLL